MDCFSFIIHFSVVLLHTADLLWFLKLPVITWSQKTLRAASGSPGLSPCAKASCWLSCWPAASQQLTTICSLAGAMPTLEPEQGAYPLALWFPWRSMLTWQLTCFCSVLSQAFNGRKQTWQDRTSCPLPGFLALWVWWTVLSTAIRSHAPGLGGQVTRWAVSHKIPMLKGQPPTWLYLEMGTLGS